MYDPTDAPDLPLCQCCGDEHETPRYAPEGAFADTDERFTKCGACLSVWGRYRARSERTHRRRAALRAMLAEGRADRAAARTLAAEARATDERLAAQAPAGTRRALAAAARRLVMQEAHVSAVAENPNVPYAARLAATLRAAYARPRRAPLSTLRRQALAWAACAAESGARFDVLRKACDALAFSATNDLRSLAIPSKLIGTRAHQPAADALAARLATHGGWSLAKMDGIHAVHFGPHRLGAVQPKHAATWLRSLGPVRLAVVAVTGGEPYEDRRGHVARRTRGVNVALEVGDAAAAWAARPTVTERLDAMEAEFAGLF